MQKTIYEVNKLNIIDRIGVYLDEVDYNPKSYKNYGYKDTKNWTPEQHRERAAKHQRSAERLKKKSGYEQASKQEAALARQHERTALRKEGKGKSRAPKKQTGPGKSYSVYD